MLRAIFFAIALAALGGCSVQPLPQDVTGYNTYQIVSKIRCEARDAVRGYAISFIRKKRPDLADALKSGRIGFDSFDRKQLDPETLKLVDRYAKAEIAYDFSFDITEKNDVGGSADFLRTFSRGPLKLPLTAGMDRERQNTRNFRISDRFGDLASKVSDDYCVHATKEKNWIYPITGHIGLAELVGTFLDLNQSGNLSPKEGKTVRTIADTIEFTTKISGSAKPSIELTPVGRGFQVTKAGLSFSGSREDVHKVIVALALPAEEAPRGAKGAGKSAKAVANEMIDEQIGRKAIDDRRRLEKRLLERLE